MAIAWVNTAKHQNASGNSTLTITVSFTVGNFACIGIGFNVVFATSNVISITDNVNSNYQFYKTIDSGTEHTELWFCPKIAGSATTLTATVNVNSTLCGIAEQYSGVVDDDGLCASNSANNTAGTISLTTADNNNFVVAFFTVKNAATWTSVTGNLRDSVVGSGTIPGMAASDNTSATPASVTNAVTLGTSGNWSAVAMELKTVALSATIANNSLQQVGCGI